MRERERERGVIDSGRWNFVYSNIYGDDFLSQIFLFFSTHPPPFSLSLSLQCLHEVLAISSDVKLILLPGDNDIGGEGSEGMKDNINQLATPTKKEICPYRYTPFYTRISRLSNSYSALHIKTGTCVFLTLLSHTTCYAYNK